MSTLNLTVVTCVGLHISGVDFGVSGENQEGKETSLGKHLSKLISRNSSGGLEGFIKLIVVVAKFSILALDTKSAP